MVFQEYAMSLDATTAVIAVSLLVLSGLWALKTFVRIRFPLDGHVSYLWTFFLAFGVSEAISFQVGIWILALLSFLALKEYFSLIDIRYQDRWAILASYLSVPFMFYFVQIAWYGMFIISVPVYAFLVVPFLVALGGKEAQGSVFSIGAIDLGLFLFVFCIGHIAYLSLYSTWYALFLILSVLLSDLVSCLVQPHAGPGLRRTTSRLSVSIPLTVTLAWGLSAWTQIPLGHSILLGFLIPVLAAVGRYTFAYIESDLGVQRSVAVPGRGQVIDTLRSFVYASPIVFHYLRYYLT